MSFKARVGAINFPTANDTINVYDSGTTNLVSGLLSPDGEGTTISNPIIVPENGWYGFEVPESMRVDIWWVEGDRYLLTNYDPFDYTAVDNPFPQYIIAEEESDPVFSYWNKSDGISITKDQITDFGAYQEKLVDQVNIKTIEGNSLTGSGDLVVTVQYPEETDPIFTAWDKSTGISITKGQIIDLGDYQEELISGTNIKTINNESILGSGDLFISTDITETDPIFSAWNKSEGIIIKKNQILDFGDYQEKLVDQVNIKTIEGNSLTGSGDLVLLPQETDPVFTAWDKSTGISITKDQIIDLGDYQEELVSGTNIKTINGESVLGEGILTLTPEETDPIFTAWDKSTGISITESQIVDFGNKQDVLISGTNIRTINGESVLGSGDLVLLPQETDPVFTAWDKSTGISITKDQIIDLGDYQEELVSGTNIKTVNYKSLLGSGNLSIEAIPSQDGNVLIELVNTELGSTEWQNRALGERRKEIGGILRTVLGSTVDDTWLKCDGEVYANFKYPELAPIMQPHAQKLDGLQWKPEPFDIEFFGITYSVDGAEFQVITKNTTTGEFIAKYKLVLNESDGVYYTPILTSMDGVNWSLKGYLNASYVWDNGTVIQDQKSIDMVDLQYVQYLDKYICLHDERYVMYSGDGVNWNGEDLRYDLGTNVGEPRVLTHSNELGVVVCLGEGRQYYDSGSGQYVRSCNSFYSYDVVAWHKGSIYSGNRSFTKVEWSPDLGLFVALGYGWDEADPHNNINDAYDYLAVSSNGQSWTIRTRIQSGFPQSIIWSPLLGKFYAVVSDYLLESVDGVSWNHVLKKDKIIEVKWLAGINKLILLNDIDNILGYTSDGYSWKWLEYGNVSFFPTTSDHLKYYDESTKRINVVGGYYEWGVDAFEVPNLLSVDGETSYIKARNIVH